jgi:hypothetical protein
MLAEYRVHPEAKSLGPDDKPCDKQTVGLLSRRHVTPIPPLRHRGKEGNRIDEREAGIADPDATHTEYSDPAQDPLWQLTRDVIRTLPVEQTADGAGISQRTVKRALAGQPVGKTARTKLTDHAVKHARAQLRATGIPRPPDREALLATVLDRQRTPDPELRLCACECGEPVPAGARGRPRKYVDETHRKRAQRRQR